MDSREYAQKLKDIAEFLDSRPEFNYIGSKEDFVAAAKAIGDATKSVGDGEYANFTLTAKNCPDLKLIIPRDAVCRKTVKYECEPLFSHEEMEAL